VKGSRQRGFETEVAIVARGDAVFRAESRTESFGARLGASAGLTVMSGGTAPALTRLPSRRESIRRDGRSPVLGCARFVDVSCISTRKNGCPFREDREAMGAPQSEAKLIRSNAADGREKFQRTPATGLSGQLSVECWSSSRRTQRPPLITARQAARPLNRAGLVVARLAES